MSWEGEALPGQPEMREAEFLLQLADGRRVFRHIPGWYPVDSMGDRTGTLVNDKWVEDFGPENYEYIQGEIP